MPPQKIWDSPQSPTVLLLATYFIAVGGIVDRSSPDIVENCGGFPMNSKIPHSLVTQAENTDGSFNEL